MLLTTLIVCVLAIAIDFGLGEPRRWHPLVGFGYYAQWLAKLFRMNTTTSINANIEILLGMLCWVCAALLPVLGIFFGLRVLESRVIQDDWAVIEPVLSLMVLYLAIGQKSLLEHAMAVYRPLSQKKLKEARLALAMIVSRDTSELSEQQITKATVETVLENTNDAVIAPLFWFCIAGIPGVLLFRLANTLDAMWGYRTKQYENFGKTAARMDDLLGWLPARLTVLLFAIKNVYAFRGAWVFGRKWYSPNAGPVMAAGAGALNVQLGGGAQYNGEYKPRPLLYDGRPVQACDIRRAVNLMLLSSLIFLGMLLFAWVIHLW